MYQDKQVEFKRRREMSRKTKSKSKSLSVLIHVLYHEDVPGCVGILACVLDLGARWR